MNIKTQTQNTKVLGQDVNQALRELVRLNKRLIEFADQETQSLVTSDHMRFAITQQDKESLARQYMQASEEFRTRLDDFRHADKSILMQLEKLQTELKEKTQNNNVLIDQIKTRAAANTQSTLFTVQELGQRVRLPDNAALKDTNKEERVAS